MKYVPIVSPKVPIPSKPSTEKQINVTKCDRFDTSKLSFAPIVTDYKNSPYYQLSIGTTEKSFKDKFGFKNIPIECLTIRDNGLTIAFNNTNLTSKPKQRKYIDFLKSMDRYLLETKNTTFERLAKHGLKSHPDLYLHRPIISETKNMTYINMGYSKDKNSNIVTKFTKNKIVSSISTDFIDFKTAKESYKNYGYVYVVFKAMVKYSKNGDDGQRTYSIKLTALDVHFGEKYGSLHNAKHDLERTEITSDDDIFVEI